MVRLPKLQSLTIDGCRQCPLHRRSGKSCKRGHVMFTRPIRSRWASTYPRTSTSLPSQGRLPGAGGLSRGATVRKVVAALASAAGSLFASAAGGGRSMASSWLARTAPAAVELGAVLLAAALLAANFEGAVGLAGATGARKMAVAAFGTSYWCRFERESPCNGGRWRQP